MNDYKLGIAVVGVGGAVGTTMAAGIELIRQGKASTDGLPLAGIEAGLAHYTNTGIGGWDLLDENLGDAASRHNVLTLTQFETVRPKLSIMKPWPAVANKEFLANIEGSNLVDAKSHTETTRLLREKLNDFASHYDGVVLINLASTEGVTGPGHEVFASVDSFEKAIAENSRSVSPAMLYAYAAIMEGIPYGNFTPSVAVEIPALMKLAERNRVPVAGKDGKTGQTFIKTVLAPALKARALRVDGWYSTNLLGNRDGLALRDSSSRASKIKTKASVLRSILGYEVEDHIVDIRYYRPRGDDKEAWDNIDVTGFLGQSMQLKVNFLCKDSILAAPLAIEIARCLDMAKRRGESGVQEQLSVFFKLPMSENGEPEHAFHRQEERLLSWLRETHGSR